MAMPNIPDINPEITLTTDQVLNLILASIGLEELGLAHILNAEGEKIQAAIGLATSLPDLIAINESVEKTLRAVIKKQMLLQFKLEDVLALLPTINIFSNIATVEGFFNEMAYTATDIAYYNTGTT